MTAANPTVAHPAERLLRPGEQDLYDAWRELVEANAEQESRLRETVPAKDYWAPGRRDHPIYHIRLDQPSPQEQAIQNLLKPDDTVFDIGAGTGGQAILYAQSVCRVRAWDPSPGMTSRMRENVNAFNARNVDVLPHDAWPPPNIDREVVDVSFTIHVTYFEKDIGGFLDAMEAQTRRICVVVANERGTGWQPIEPLFEGVHGEKFIRLPGAPELLAVLTARRREVNVQAFPLGAPGVQDIDSVHDSIREDYWLEHGSEKDNRLRQLILGHFGIGSNQVQMPPKIGLYNSMISWGPRRE